MKPARRMLSLAAVAALGAASYGVGTHLVQNVQFARAEAQVNQAMAELQAPNDLSTVYKQINHAIENSVVQIQVIKTVHGVVNVPNQRFFRFFGPNGQMPDQGDQGQADPGQGDEQQPDDGTKEEATGSGVIMDVANGEGFIVTNNHVISDATKVTVLLNDGRNITDATVVASDPKSDIAVVKIKADRLISAKWGDSDKIEKGDIIVAFGSPMGYVGSMSHGIVSATNRQAGVINGDFAYENFIQVDAAINPGNSGGPLVDLKGEVIGINTAIASRSGMFSGIGFAIPSNQARTVYDSLRNSGHVSRGYLGVKIADVSSPVEDIKSSIASLGFKGDTGVLVNEVLADGPAANVLQPGDVITEIDGKTVKTMIELRNRIAMLGPKASVKLTVWRDKKTQQIDVKLGEQPDAEGAVASNMPAKPQHEARLGIGLTTPTAADLDNAGLPEGSKGALVQRVLPGSAAARLGLKPGDLITRIGETEVATADDAKAALGKIDSKEGVRIDVTNRAGKKMMTFRATDKLRH